MKNTIKIHETVAGIGIAFDCELCEIVAERCGDSDFFADLSSHEVQSGNH